MTKNANTNPYGTEALAGSAELLEAGTMQLEHGRRTDAETRWGTLLRRQAELQRVGGLPAPEPWQLETALLDELGELNHELKPLWAWWAKPGMGSEVNPERVLAEAADVLHFLLLRELYAEDSSAEEHYRLTPLLGDPPPSAQASLVSILQALPFVAACHLCGVVARFGYTPGDLTRAYWEKTEENLRRWREAADPAPEAPESPEPEPAHRCAHVPGDYERLAAHVATTRAQLAQRDAALAGAEALVAHWRRVARFMPRGPVESDAAAIAFSTAADQLAQALAKAQEVQL